MSLHKDATVNTHREVRLSQWWTVDITLYSSHHLHLVKWEKINNVSLECMRFTLKLATPPHGNMHDSELLPFIWFVILQVTPLLFEPCRRRITATKSPPYVFLSPALTQEDIIAFNVPPTRRLSELKSLIDVCFGSVSGFGHPTVATLTIFSRLERLVSVLTHESSYSRHAAADQVAGCMYSRSEYIHTYGNFLNSVN